MPFYNDTWMDNALENFYSLLVENDYDNKLNINLNQDELCISVDENYLKDILINIIKNYKYYSCVKEEKDGEIIEYKKDFIIIQHNRVESSIILKPNLFKNPDDEIPKLLSTISDGSKICSLCGLSFNKKYDFLKQSVYPLSTKIKSLNGVRSYKNCEYFTFKDYNDSLCPLCYLIGILGWFTKGIIYRSFMKDNSFLLFLPKLNNLKELHEFKENYSYLLNNNRRWSNIRVSIDNDEIENTYGKFSTLLCFYGKFLLLYEDIPEINWDIFSIPNGKVKNIKTQTFSFNETILNIIKIFINDYCEDIYVLFDSIYITTDNKIDNDLSNQLKENLSESFLNNNFGFFSKNFIIKNGKKLIFSDKKIKFFKNFDIFIYLWRIKPMGIDVDDLKTIKSVANIISKVSIRNLSLFYKLDKVKNIEEFWNCLREISKKLVSPELDKEHIKETSLDNLIILLKNNEKNWKEIRDLLIIYSSMYYSISKRSDENEN